MKICPDCQERYADDVVTCPKDGEELVDLPAELSGNPLLQEPVPASPADRTSMIDLEAIEAQREAKKAAKRAEDGDDDEDKTPPPEEPLEEDGEATGTMQRSGRRRRKDPSRIAEEAEEGGDEEEDGRYPADRRVNEELTDREMSRASRSRSRMSRAERSALAEGSRTSMTRQTHAGTRAGTQVAQKKAKRSLSATQAAFLVMFGVVALVGGIAFVARATAVLTVTTVPPGATVVVDGKTLGTSPVQKRLRTGSHVVELTLIDYEPYKEVVEVPSGGLPFLQPLHKKPPPPPPPPTPAEIAVDMAKAAAQLLGAGELDAAQKKLADALQLSPGCAPCAALKDKVDAALKKRDGDLARQEAAGARAARLRRARVLAAEGQQLYRDNHLATAKQKLTESLTLDPGNPEPHRTLARIFNREDEVQKVRYHLQRYLDLGGADGDFKVREWLKSHPK